MTPALDRRGKGSHVSQFNISILSRVQEQKLLDFPSLAFSLYTMWS